MTKNKYLVRFNYARAKGWQFRYPKANDWADCESRFFSDAKYGGSRKALQAAKAYRDRRMKTRGLEYRLNKARVAIHPTRKQALNTSGVIGLKRAKTEKSHGIYYHWVAYGMQNNTPWQRSFAVLLYGERRAFRLACRERFKRHGQLYITTRIQDLPAHPGVPYSKNCS